MSYSHTQVGHLIIIVMAAVVMIFSIVSFQSGFEPLLLVFMAVILGVLVSFLWLTVSVDKTTIRLRFGYGLFGKTFPVSGIASAKAVRNHWYYGWGIKVWFWPYMWIYNVSGFDAVEILMKDGKRARIGTDEPKALLEAILKAMKQ